MFKKQEKRFLYHAHALGLAGHFTSPYVEPLETQAASALPVSGGVASARVENFRHRDLVSFRAAQTRAIGHYNPESGAYNTLVTASIEQLNIMDVVTAQMVVARIASRHFLDGREASILALGSHIEELRIGGLRVNYQPNSPIMGEWDTFSKASEAAKKHPELVATGPMLATSICTQVSCGGGLKVEGNRIDLPDFGSIYLGELFITHGERRLSMIRVELGCAVRGEVNGGDVSGNGTPYPP